jgi:hypothetical protein
MKPTSWVALVVLVLLGGVIVYSSLHVGSVRCEVCVRFASQEACRAVDGASEDEALRAAQTNACARLASGVTDTMACERTEPFASACSAR